MRNRASVCAIVIFDPSLFQLFLIKFVIHGSLAHFKPTDKIFWLSNLKNTKCVISQMHKHSTHYKPSLIFL